MIITTFISTLALAFGSVMTTTEDLQPSPSTTLMTQTTLEDDPIATGNFIGSSDISEAPSGHASRNSSVGVPGHGTAERGFRLECKNVYLTESKTRQGVYYIAGTCSGLYDQFFATRCSYLDLDMCFVNVDGTIKPRMLGGFSSKCYDCSHYVQQTTGTHFLHCWCDAGHDEDHLIENRINLDEVISVKNGFLSCFGITNFECPLPGEPDDS
ncbi:hypothetical protein DL769_011211 [Monosporascus sp. CRB-8-3]|nr:hypothetical protein DL769_011211 [Monosporascus sp. CRB-8-3]